MSRENWSNEKIFFRLLNNKTQKTYWANIHQLHIRPCQEVFDRGMALAKSELDKEKIIGIDVLAQLGVIKRFNQQQIIDLYFSILNTQQTPKVLATTLSAIGHNNKKLKKKHILTISKFKNHNYSDVRFGVVCALMTIDHELATESLIELTRDNHHLIRDWATFSIGTQSEVNNPAVLKALKARLTDTDYNTRREAIAGLAKRRDASVREILIDELENIDEHGSIILESIEEYGDQSFIPLIQGQIKKNKISKNVNEKWLTDCIETLRKK